MRIFLIFSILSLRFLTAEDSLLTRDEAIQQSCASTEGILSAIIDHKVSAISGEMVDCQTDLYLIGPEPLIWQRSYNSNPDISQRGFDPIKRGKGHYYALWQHLQSTNCYYQIDQSGHSADHFFALIPHPSASLLAHTRHSHHPKEAHYLNFDTHKGWTNCAAGAINARTNPKNAKAKFNVEKGEFCVQFGSGDHRYYKKVYSTIQHDITTGTSLPIRERKANGNQIIYKDGDLQTKNKEGTVTFGWIKRVDISQFEKHFENSHMDPVIYKYTEKKASRFVGKEKVSFNQALLTSVSRPDKPEEHYSYVRMAEEGNRLLAKKKLPEGRFTAYDYYNYGDAPGELAKIPIFSPIDPRKGRVKSIMAPVGTDSTPIVTHRFFYDLDIKLHKERYAKVGQGWTTVYNAYGHKTKYYYNDDQRLTATVEYEGNTPHLTTQYLWVDDHKDADAGNLMGKIVCAGHQIQHGRFFRYDARGNILTEKFCGNLSGFSQIPLALKGHKPQKNGVETFKKKYAYSNCDYNLLLSEKEPYGKTILYDYYPASDLIKRKLVLDQDKVLTREFYAYDTNNVLVRFIRDDGCGQEPHDLTHVTERKITYIHPRKEIPIGLPECIEEKYWDGTQERTLKTTYMSYSRAGHLLEERVFDSEGQFRFVRSKEVDAHGNITKEVDALGQVIIKRYDANDNLIFEQGPAYDHHTVHYYDFSNRKIRTDEVRTDACYITHYRYDYLGNLIAKIDRLGQETLYRYDEHSRLIETQYPSVLFENRLVQPLSKYSYNPFGDLLCETDPMMGKTERKFNARSKATEVHFPDGRTEKIEYRLDGLVAKKQMNGSITHFEYDALGRTISEKITDLHGNLLCATQANYSGTHLTSSVDAMGIETYYRYDGAGRLIQKQCLDKIENYHYDSLGRQSKKIEAERVIIYAYDLLDRIIKESIEDLQGQALKSISYRYDQMGNRTQTIEETQAGLSITTIEYNPDKKPKRLIDPDGNESHFIYDYQHINAYGQRVLQVRLIDALGRITLTTFDTLDRPVLIQKQDPYGQLLSSQETHYDLNGNPTRVIDQLGEEKIELGMTYNPSGKLTALIEAAGRPEQKITRYDYNSYGEQIAHHKPDGVILHSQYDSLGRLSAHYSSDGSLHHQYEYNHRHQPVRISELITQTHTLFTYDSHGRAISEQLAHGQSLHYTYDLLDRILAVTLPDSTTINYKYDAFYLREVKRGAFSHTYEKYDLSGQFQEGHSIFGKPIKRSYTASKQIKGWQDPQWQAENFQYDVLARLTQIDRAGEIQSFAYDHLDHLISEPLNHYTCDALHRRTTKNGVVLHYNTLHQLLEYGDIHYQYDVNGNLIKKTQNGKDTTYQYDALDRLITITADAVTHYTYDPLHRRLTKNNERYLYIGQNEIGSIDTQQLRILGQGQGAEIGATVAIELKGQIYEVSHDYRGNITALTNDQETHHYRYTAFGEKLESSKIDNPWQFAGKRFDPESGLIYFGRRYYDPETARWITPDPAGLIDGSNLYAYLHHSYKNYDLYGLNEETPGEAPAPIANVDYREERKPTQKTEDVEVNTEPKEVQRGKKRYHWCGSLLCRQLGICFINGIQNTFENAKESASMLSDMANEFSVNFVHNRSLGFIGFDIVRSFFELYFWRETESVRNLRATWDELLERDPTMILLQCCHSEGALIVRNALKNYQQKSRISVVAISPAAYIDDTGTAGVRHYRSTRDIVPLLDVWGRWKHRDTTVVLKAHQDAPWFDHSFNSPTFKNVQRIEIQTYMQQYRDV